MTKLFLLSLLIVPAALSGCSSNDGSPREGQYQQTVKITELNFPGMSAEMKAQTIEQMEQAAGGGTAGLSCLVGDDGGEQWKQAASEMSNLLGGECKTIKDEGSTSRMDLEMKCTGTAKGDMAITMTGASHSEGYETAMSFDMSDPASQETAKLAMEINAKRVGDCPG